MKRKWISSFHSKGRTQSMPVKNDQSVVTSYFTCNLRKVLSANKTQNCTWIKLGCGPWCACDRHPLHPLWDDFFVFSVDTSPLIYARSDSCYYIACSARGQYDAKPVRWAHTTRSGLPALIPRQKKIESVPSS